MFGIRKTLQLGALVFGASALLLLFLPEFFLQLLMLDASSLALVWAMRMIGITLVALAGNMWLNSKHKDDDSVRQVGIVMAIAANGLGTLTLFIPASMGWFTYAYAAVGFLFGINYVVCLLREKI